MWRCLLLAIIASGCGAVNPYYSEENTDGTGNALPDASPEHIIYLIGDAGALQKSDPLINAVQTSLEAGPENSLIFLGDNLYHNGLPDEDDVDRGEKEEILNNQMEIGLEHPGPVYFIPGNHDWDDAGEDGLNAVRRQEVYIENYLDRGNVFLPDNGCPGPVSVSLSDEITLILIDSQWWLHEYDIPAGGTCGVESRSDFAEKLHAMVEANKDRHVLLVGHHPVRSNGEHGGYFGIGDHIFPLVNLNKYLYIPLPVIGSIYPIVRSTGVSRQDIPNDRFQTYAMMIDSLFQNHSSLIYASGHDHNVQYIQDGQVRQIVSGSGSKVNYVSKGRGSTFTYQERGYGRLIYYASNEIWLEFYQVNIDGAKVVFRKKIVG